MKAKKDKLEEYNKQDVKRDVTTPCCCGGAPLTDGAACCHLDEKSSR